MDSTHAPVPTKNPFEIIMSHPYLMNPLKTPDPANKLNITITLSHFVMTMLLTFCWPELLPAEPAPDLIRAEIYQDDIDPSGFWISEKLDGVRAYCPASTWATGF